MDAAGGDPIIMVATTPMRITLATVIGITTITATITPTSPPLDAKCGPHLP
jgi:hypothetical protein